VRELFVQQCDLLVKCARKFHQRVVIDPTEQTPFRRVLQSYKLAHFQALATPQKNFRTSRLTLAIDSAIFQASHLAPLHLRPRC